MYFRKLPSPSPEIDFKLKKTVFLESVKTQTIKTNKKKLISSLYD